MIKKIYIPTINSYSGGILVLAVLCKTLRELGYDARLLIIPYFPSKKVKRVRFIFDCLLKNIKFRIKSFIKKYAAKIFPTAKFVKYYKSAADILKIENIKVQWHPFFNKEESIVVYCDYMYGNPLGADKIARWLLSFYQFKHDSNAYSKSDVFIAFREMFNDLSLNPNNYLVTLNYFNHQLYRQYNYKKRDGVCYIVYKGWNRTDLPKHFDGPVYKSSMLQEDLVDMLNHYKYCYCYDTQSYYTIIAAVCGCIPIVIMEKGKTERDYLSPTEKHYGIAYGNTSEQIQYAIDTRELLLQKLDYRESNIKNAKKMLSILVKHFGKIKQLSHGNKTT